MIECDKAMLINLSLERLKETKNHHCVVSTLSLSYWREEFVFHHIMQMIQSGQYFTEGLSYTSVRMTGSNFGNFFNGALKDFEAKQASRIRVRVWEFP